MRKLFYILFTLIFLSCSSVANKICPDYCEKQNAISNYPDVKKDLPCHIIFDMEKSGDTLHKDLTSLVPIMWVEEIQMYQILGTNEDKEYFAIYIPSASNLMAPLCSVPKSGILIYSPTENRNPKYLATDDLHIEANINQSNIFGDFRGTLRRDGRKNEIIIVKNGKFNCLYTFELNL